MNDRLEGFLPVADPDARVLILGSMPGEASLQRQQYYGHPGNAFWPIMGELFGAGPDLPYPARLDRLRARRIALWDVIHSCHRSGSLDAAIDDTSVEPNDFAGLFARCPGIGAVFFNGQKAASLFRRRVHPLLGDRLQDVELVCLPSTSPAHASRTRAEKVAAWREIRQRLG